MRYRKRKKAAAQVMVMTVTVVAVLAALLVLACSQVFRVRGILIVGNRNLSKEDVIALSGVQEGDNLFSISDAELKKNMERNRYIEYLGHEFDYRGTLSLHINERMGMGVVTGMLPTTGLPLPFFSAGGTSVSVMMAAVGVLLSISRENGARIVEPTDQQSGGRA